MDCALRLPKPRSSRIFYPLVSSTSLSNASRLAFKSHFSFSPVAAAASVQNRSAARKQSKQNLSSGDDDEDSDGRGDSGVILSACLVGVLTGIGVVLFNNGVHEIRDIFWDGIPSRGASWLREAPIDSVWVRVILVPASGGLIVGFLNAAREAISRDGNEAVAALRPLLKAVAACVTLGTGNSLGPEGPSVEIGSSVAKGVHHVFDKNPLTRLSLLAAGSAAGISSGFNAAVAGCFFAVESVLWPSADSSVSLTNTTSTVILSAVIGSVVSEIGLGSEPAFKVPDYDFRSPGELPLYLLLGILCGLVSLALSRCTSYLLSFVDAIHKDVGIPKPVFPILGGLSIGVISLAYPEILYWGFENVDILLESRPFVNCLSADLLFQLVGVKILATSLCRASGLVGGYYAPSLFIGAATGMAYGKFINFTVAQFNPTLVFPLVEVASPQAYGLVGMAATLAGVCQVPLTSVLLLFELTQDYRIVLPLLGAVGLSSWVTSGQMKRKSIRETKAPKESSTQTIQQLESLPDNSGGPSSIHILPAKTSDADNICEVESSLCVEDLNIETTELRRKIFVSEAMRTRYVTVLMSTLLTEAVTLMLAEKQSCAIMVDGDNLVIGLLTLTDIQEFSTYAKYRSLELKELLISDICELDGKKCRESWTATPMMDLLSAVRIMNKHGVSQVPVVLEHVQEFRGRPVGLLDRECISLTYRAIAARESLV